MLEYILMNASHQWDKYLLLPKSHENICCTELACMRVFIHMGGICEHNLFSIKSNVLIDWNDVNIHGWAVNGKRFFMWWKFSDWMEGLLWDDRFLLSFWILLVWKYLFDRFSVLKCTRTSCWPQNGILLVKEASLQFNDLIICHNYVCKTKKVPF